MKTTTAVMSEWILRREINAYIKRRTCPFCGGTLSGRHPRAENGRILPMSYVCRQCGRNPREALADDNHEPAGQSPRPEGGSTMTPKKSKKAASKKQVAKKHDETTPTGPPAGTAEEKPVAMVIEREAPTDGTADGTEIVVFAFRLTRGERDEIHAATGSAKASKFIRTLALAGARGDMKAVQETIDEVHAARQ